MAQDNGDSCLSSGSPCMSLASTIRINQFGFAARPMRTKPESENKTAKKIGICPEIKNNENPLSINDTAQPNMTPRRSAADNRGSISDFRCGGKLGSNMDEPMPQRSIFCASSM